MNDVVDSPAGPSGDDAHTFRVALCMAGAISAGAYTAGVYDFLMEALAEWETKRGPGVPDHKVRIVAMSGASAGGITSALGTVALGRGLIPTSVSTRWRGTIDCVLPSLYDAWVVRPCMVSQSGLDLLSTQDLDAGGDVLSLLNWRVLDSIRDAVLKLPTPPPPPPPYAFLAKPLHLFLTVSNLRGVPYEIDFGAAPYRMLDHGDRMHFAVTDIGVADGADKGWADADPAMTLTLPDLNAPGGPLGEWPTLGNSALATSAFPIGLAARQLGNRLDTYDRRQWPIPLLPTAVIHPAFSASWRASNPVFNFINVDGGMIDNEPFELARYAILPVLGTTVPPWQASLPKGRPASFDDHNPRDPAQANRAVIMIAPFPEGSAFAEADPLLKGLVAVLKSLPNTLVQQCRFKPGELAAAADPGVASRFLIAPRAQEHGSVSSEHIACGLLGGFGGFLADCFREYDFLLGQLNCKWFLQNEFTLAPDNPVFGTVRPRPNGQGMLPIIPLLGSAATKPLALAPWPAMSRADVAILMKRIGKRADKLVPALSREQIGSTLLRWGLKGAWWLGLRCWLMKKIRWAILADLIRRGQIGAADDGLALAACSADERKALAALADSAFELRTVTGVANATAVDRAVVQGAFDKAEKLDGNEIHRVWRSDIRKNDAATYTLFSRRPAWHAAPVIGSLLQAVNPLDID